MPKNWTVNTKSAQAKAVKTAARNEEAERKQKALEDKMWEDNDKHVLKKQQRLEEKEKKDKERLEKKLEAKKLLDEEMSQLKSAKPEKASVAPSSSRMTQYEIDKIKERQEKAAAEAAQAALQAQKKLEVVEPELLENVNRIKIEGEVARNVEEAISILNDKPASEVDMHPEKRMRAAYLEFEEEHLERLKKENPNLRLSQIKQMLKKDWMKSPKNPMNKVFLQ